MHVTQVRTTLVAVPLARPVRTAIHEIGAVHCVLIEAASDAGPVGESYVFAFGVPRARVLEAMVAALAPRLVGRDPHDHGAIWRELWGDINFLGHKGVTVIALSGLESALWDLVGKAAGLSVGRLLGRVRDRVPAYASGGLWLSCSTDELVAEARQFVADGFRAVKMRLGKADPGEDAERVAAVRETIGAGITLMADANQGFSADHAIRLGRLIEPCRLAWFEEPVPAYDLEGSARVAAALDTPVASGETEYTRYGFREMIAKRAADVLMPDLQRAGGVAEFLRIAAMAAAEDIPVSPHIFTEQSLQLCAAIPNCTIAEHMPWFAPLFRERMELVDGDLLIPDRPGLGFTFDHDAIERYRVRG